mmetsp:Transcript_7572/g.19684  ORF Transcript_7572/g.19684 Transcript_7572/m.19684 type:complete len:205 (+) Transcript_7572:58-672(+)
MRRMCRFGSAFWIRHHGRNRALAQKPVDICLCVIDVGHVNLRKVEKVVGVEHARREHQRPLLPAFLRSIALQQCLARGESGRPRLKAAAVNRGLVAAAAESHHRVTRDVKLCVGTSQLDATVACADPRKGWGLKRYRFGLCILPCTRHPPQVADVPLMHQTHTGRTHAVSDAPFSPTTLRRRISRLHSLFEVEDADVSAFDIKM